MNNIGPYNKGQMANFCLNLVLPRLKAALRRFPKGVRSYQHTTKVRFICMALDKILNDPNNAQLKHIVHNATVINTRSPDMRYFELATKLRNAV